MRAQRTRFQRALGADVGPEAIEEEEEVGMGVGLGFDDPLAGGRSGAAGGEAQDPWGGGGDLGFLGPPALDEDAQREWRAFVEKSKAAAVRTSLRHLVPQTPTCVLGSRVQGHGYRAASARRVQQGTSSSCVAWVCQKSIAAALAVHDCMALREAQSAAPAFRGTIISYHMRSPSAATGRAVRLDV